MVRNEIIQFSTRLLKSVTVAEIENKPTAAAVGIIGDRGLEELNDIISDLNYQIDRILDEEELIKLGVPKNQAKDIKERLLGFLGEVELSDIASVSIYDQEKMTKRLWKQYCEYLEDSAPEGFVKPVLYSISVKSIQVLKERKNFVADGIIRIMQKIEDDPGSNSPSSIVRREKEEQQIRLLSRNLISENQDTLKNEVILPWMKHSLSYRAVFPEIFIDPMLYGNKISGQITYKQLLEKYQDKNLALIGEAGAGKSTLMRHIYLENNPECTFLYLKAGALVKKYEDLSPYEQGVVSLLHGEQNVEQHRVILLDEMDETFINSVNDLEKVLKKLFRKPKGISIWFGWRSEHFSQKLTPEIQSFLYDILEIHRWDEDLESVESIENPAKSMVFSYVLRYEKITDSRGLYNRFKELAKNNEKVYEIAKTPINLALLLYLLEEKDRGKKKDEKINTENLNLYSLYDQFFMCWVQREKGRGTSSIHMEQIKKELQQAAEMLYYGNECRIESEDTAVTDLLVFSYHDRNNGEKIATEFCHRSFCAFFYGKRVFESIRQGGIDLIQTIKQPLRNDVTNFVRAAIESVKYTEDLSVFKNNMMELYLQTEHMEQPRMDEESYAKLCTLSARRILYLQNELIYFITRLPELDEDIEKFLDEAYANTDNPYLKLDIAYGAVLTEHSRVGLEYAKSLKPGSDSDKINRSWTVAYFGDVQANPYLYQDTRKASWKKSREARLKRFQSDKRKALKFRILDIPLMYCFYVSREWKDVNPKDFAIIKQTVVDHPIYTEEEKEFLREQKKQLVEEYEKNLRRYNR